MAMKKRYFKTKSHVRVTFRIPASAAEGANTVHLVGDFNQWKEWAAQMKKLKDGCFTLDLNLAPGQEYQFRYLIDRVRWENDYDADRYATTPFGTVENSVVKV
jgi:1,4-alpha-glucan branching enzyme